MLNIDWLINEVPVAAPKQKYDIAFKGADVLKLTEVKRTISKKQKSESSFQDNIRRCGDLRNKILIGVSDGTSITELLLMATECISRMTADKQYQEQIVSDLTAVHGYGLHEEGSLQVELKRINRNIAHITQALSSQSLTVDQRKRIEKSLALHNKKAESIMQMIDDKGHIA